MRTQYCSRKWGEPEQTPVASGLEKAALRQLLLSTIVRDELGGDVRRDGDDLFLGPGKPSISIATLTPVSYRVPFGINIERALDVGIETRALIDRGVDSADLACCVLARYASQIAGIRDARTRVRGVP